MATDKVPAVRMEFARSFLHVKPFLESDLSLANELMNLLDLMHSDIDREVVDAVEICDYELL